jgi:hypothetical protein
MKLIRALILSLLLPLSLFGQVDRPQAASSKAQGFTGSTGTYVGELRTIIDIYQSGYIADSVAVGHKFLDSRCNMYSIAGINSVNTGRVSVIVQQDGPGPFIKPTGSGVIYVPLDRGFIPSMPDEDGQLPPFVETCIANHNAARAAAIGGGRVEADTLAYSEPKEGDVALMGESEIYFYDGTQWVLRDAGPEGQPGTDGAPGTSFISQAGAPTIDDGNEGDTYLDLNNNFLYGPKTAGGAWPFAGELNGDVGPPGAGLQIDSTVATIGDLPLSYTGEVGDLFLIDDGSGNAFVWNAENLWSLVPIRGPQGLQGLGFTGGSYDPATGIITFTSDDGLGFQTSDLRGQPGADGADGADGVNATISVGTTTTGAPGAPASVVNSGTPTAAVLDFTIPKGDTGDPGADGNDGAPGADGADGADATVAVGTTTTGAEGTNASVTNSGTPSAAVFNFTIPRGDKGDTGDPGSDGNDGAPGADGADGNDATVAVGTTTTSAPGTNANVTNTGTPGAAIFNFTIPRGDKGDQGDPGTPGADGSDGAPGADGSDGAAATVTVGSTTTSAPGTNANVTNSGNTTAAVLEFTIPRGEPGADGADGNDGAPGAPGSDGADATVAVGTTTTGAAGTNASVTNSGTPSAAVFNFTVPRGDKGDKGDAGDPGAPGSDGNDGAPGTPGADGNDATVAVGTTTTGLPGTNANVTNTGTPGAAVFNFTIPRGDKGDTGDPGAPGADGNDGSPGAPGADGNDGADATVAIGTTTTGAEGTNATVTNTGTPGAAIFNFTIPRGDKGDTGDPGSPGADGSDGAPGADGADGTAATITVGTTTTGAPGTNASVTNTGSTNAAVLQFQIPRGDPGADGSDGAPGADGQGVPVGGAAGQVLAKIDGTDYNTNWIDAPSGGVWNINASDIYFDTGDVGIGPGADFPAQTLHVAGTMRLESLLSTTPITLMAVDANGDIVDGSALAGGGSLWTEDGGGNIRYESGSVSVGVNRSNQAFHVVGKGTFGADITSDWRGEVTIANQSAFTLSPTNDKTLLLFNPQATGVDQETLGSLFFAPYNLARAHAGIAAFQDGTDSDNIGLKFYTHPGNGSGDDAYEAAYFDDVGRLHLNRLVTDTESSIYSGLLGWNPDGQIVKVASSDFANLWQENGIDLYFNTGNVGIGTDIPTVPLDIRANNNEVGLQLQNVGGNSTVRIRNAGSPARGEIYLDNDGSNTLKLAGLGDSYFNVGDNANGNFGIGTSTPSVNLQVNDATGNLEALFSGDDFSVVRIQADNAGIGAADAEVRFNIGASELWRVGIDNSDGNNFMISNGTLSSGPASLNIREDLGYVGILSGGTPQRELHVGGRARIDDVPAGAPVSIVGVEADGDLVDGTALANVVENKDYLVLEPHDTPEDQGILTIFTPEGGDLVVNASDLGVVKIRLPQNPSNNSIEMRVRVQGELPNNQAVAGTMVFGFYDESFQTNFRYHYAYVEGSINNKLAQDWRWDLYEDGGGRHHILIQRVGGWDEKYSLKVMEVYTNSNGNLNGDWTTPWDMTLDATLPDCDRRFGGQRAAQGVDREGEHGMMIIDYPTGATWTAGNTSRTLSDQYLMITVPTGTGLAGRLDALEFKMNLSVHNEREGSGTVREIEIAGRYEASGGVPIYSYKIDGDVGSDMPLRCRGIERDSLHYFWIGDGTTDWRFEKIILTRYEVSLRQFYSLRYENWLSGWKVELVPSIDLVTTNGPFDPDRERFDLSGAELTYDGNTVDLAPAIQSELDGNGILDVGPHNMPDGNIVRGATEPLGSVGRWEQGNAVSAGGTSFNYLRAFGDNSDGFNLQMQIDETTGNTNVASLNLSDLVSDTDISSNGTWEWNAGSTRRGFNWGLNTFLLNGSDFLTLPGSQPPGNGYSWTWNSNGSGQWEDISGGGGGSDNLGNHTMTQDLIVGSNFIRNALASAAKVAFPAGGIQVFNDAETEYGAMTTDVVEFGGSGRPDRRGLRYDANDNVEWIVGSGGLFGVDTPDSQPSSNGQVWSVDTDGTGQWITPSGGGGSSGPTVLLTFPDNDVTTTSNNSTYVDIPGMEWTIPANTKGTFLLKLMVQSTGSADTRIVFTEVSGGFTDFNWDWDMDDTDEVSLGASDNQLINGQNTNRTLGHFSGVFETNGSGCTFKLQFRQGTSEATVTTVYDYSSMEIKYNP